MLKTQGSRQEVPAGMYCSRFLIESDNDARAVLARVERTLSCVLQNCRPYWPTSEQWSRILSEDFVGQFSPEATAEEVEIWLKQWRTLSPENRKIAEDTIGWTLTNWIEWFRPDERYWYWWGASVKGENRIYADILSEEVIFPKESFDWLFVANGAGSVKETSRSHR